MRWEEIRGGVICVQRWDFQRVFALYSHWTDCPVVIVHRILLADNRTWLLCALLCLLNTIHRGWQLINPIHGVWSNKTVVVTVVHYRTYSTDGTHYIYIILLDSRYFYNICHVKNGHLPFIITRRNRISFPETNYV